MRAAATRASVIVMTRSVLALVSACALLAVLLALGPAVPSPPCHLRAPDGTVLFTGTPDEAVSLLGGPRGEVRHAVRAGPALTCVVPMTGLPPT